MYGAFWCSHCHEQKEAFGSQAMKDFPYVECYPDGFHKASICHTPGASGLACQLLQPVPMCALRLLTITSWQGLVYSLQLFKSAFTSTVNTHVKTRCLVSACVLHCSLMIWPSDAKMQRFKPSLPGSSTAKHTQVHRASTSWRTFSIANSAVHRKSVGSVNSLVMRKNMPTSITVFCVTMARVKL